ncbi:hypothetical protein ASC61_01935 [Aeromicrobium sp. Root344]|nr:hypothetical protein ASC61_01935 [Aeromicrobium sp. Root344]
MSGDLSLGHILETAGLTDFTEVLAIRHTSLSHGIPDVNHTTPAAVLTYTRDQDADPRVFPVNPPKIWLVFMADGTHDGAHRARFYGAYENSGEALDERTETNRRFDLSAMPLLEALQNRLVVDWTTPIRWHRRGVLAAEFRVLEIADPQVIPFPGFDNVRLTYSELRRMIDDPHYSRWHSALSAVKGIYLIADSSNGMQYVGKADGAQGIFGRWKAYAGDGHGGNVALKDLDNLDLTHREHFVFSILRVFGPEATQKQILNAEAHFKDALLSRDYGYNEN